MPHQSGATHVLKVSHYLGTGATCTHGMQSPTTRTLVVLLQQVLYVKCNQVPLSYGNFYVPISLVDDEDAEIDFQNLEFDIGFSTQYDCTLFLPANS